MADSLVVVDTDLVIDYLRGSGDGVGVVRDLLAARVLRVTAVTAYELALGTDFHRRHADIMGLCRRRTLPLDLGSAVAAGGVLSGLRAAGIPIGMADALIAGCCLRHALPLATRNRDHFARVDGLALYRQG